MMGLFNIKLPSANLGSRHVFLRAAFMVTAFMCAEEGFSLPYLVPGFQDRWIARGLIVLLFLICFGLTYRPNWQRYSKLFFYSYLAYGFWVSMMLWDNGWFDRMFAWYLVGMIGWAYVVQTKREFQVVFGFYLIVGTLNLVFVDDGLKDRLHYGSVMYTVAALSYLILSNLKRNHHRLIKLNQKIQQSNDLFTQAQAMANISNWELDLINQTTWMSPPGYDFYELPRDYPIDAEFLLSLYPPESLALLQPAIELCREEGTPFDLRLAINTYKGNRRYVRLAGYRQKHEDSTLRLYGVIQDITQDKEDEAALRKAKEEAEAAMNAKTQFLSVMSHEIRTPMNAVIGSCHLLWEENPRTDQKENLQTLQHSAENLLSLINDILDFSKIEAGKVELERTDFDLPSKLTQLIEMYQFQAREKHLDLDLVLDEVIPMWVKGDPVRLTQILTNLMGNALKFTEKGQIQLQADLLDQTPQQATIKFSVSDTGIGIPAEKLDHIFQQFSQASSETTRKYGGTGLGLSISKRLVELMGSELKVETEVGVGTTFSFILKMRLGQPVSSADPITAIDALQPESSKPLHILLAEDNPVNIKIASRFLKNWGFQFSVAKDGLQACELARQQQFDLILMDLRMPNMGGIEATKILRESGFSAPILALSAEVSEEIREEVIQAGMNDYTSKPFVPRELKQKILHWSRFQMS